MFSFVVTNPDSAQTAPAVSIEASGSRAIASSAMAQPGTDLYGVTDGANTLLVVAPTFTTKVIGQSTAAAGKSNTITVTVLIDCGL